MDRAPVPSAADLMTAMADGQRGITPTPAATQQRAGRHHDPRREPYAWLGLGAVTLGVGAVLAIGSPVAHADDGSAAGSPSSSHAERSASASGGPARASKGSGRAARPVAGNDPAAATGGVTAVRVQAAATVFGAAAPGTSVPNAATTPGGCKSSGPTPVSTQSGIFRRRGRCRTTSTPSTQPTSCRAPSSTTSTPPTTTRSRR